MAKNAKTIALLDKGERQALERYCVLHHLKNSIVTLLVEASETHSLKRGNVTTAMNAPYEKLIESLGVALGEGWLAEAQIVSLLEAGELAGRQHVCLFRVKTSEQKKLLD